MECNPANLTSGSIDIYETYESNCNAELLCRIPDKCVPTVWCRILKRMIQTVTHILILCRIMHRWLQWGMVDHGRILRHIGSNRVHVQLLCTWTHTIQCFCTNKNTFIFMFQRCKAKWSWSTPEWRQCAQSEPRHLQELANQHTAAFHGLRCHSRC